MEAGNDFFRLDGHRRSSERKGIGRERWRPALNEPG
jgi:hypothetical protein